MRLMMDIKDNLIESLNELLRRLKVDRQSLDDKIKRLEQDLTSLDKKAGNLFLTSENTPKQRRPRGANVSIVRNYLKEKSNERFSVPQISDAIGIPRTSCWSTLKRLEKSGLVTKDDEGYWKISQ